MYWCGPRASTRLIYTDTGCNRHEVPIVTDLLVCVAQWYARVLIRYIHIIHRVTDWAGLSEAVATSRSWQVRR